MVGAWFYKYKDYRKTLGQGFAKAQIKAGLLFLKLNI